jgi:hypothetical protein
LGNTEGLSLAPHTSTPFSSWLLDRNLKTRGEVFPLDTLIMLVSHSEKIPWRVLMYVSACGTDRKTVILPVFSTEQTNGLIPGLSSIHILSATVFLNF